MKKIFTVMAAVMLAATMSASVNYELNGGWNNDYGWQTKQDMYATMNQLWNTYKNVSPESPWYTWLAIDSCKTTDLSDGLTAACYSPNPMEADFFADPNTAKAFSWLVDYMIYVCKLQEQQSDLLGAGNAAYLRYNLMAFFRNMQRTGWPKTANYEAYGNVEYFQPYWKHGFANPTDPTEEWILQNPYKEEEIGGITVKYTFDGWYDNPTFSGNKVLKIDANTTGTLYAKWVEYVPTVEEVLALPENTVTKMCATVTFFKDNVAYLQDATGGVRVEFPAGTALAMNKVFTLKGTFKTVNYAPTVVVSDVEKTENGKAIVPVEMDYVKDLVAKVGMLVKLAGKRVASYDAAGDPSFRDDYNTIAAYDLPIDQTVFTIRRKADVIGVVEKCGADSAAIRLRAFVTNVTPSAPAGQDPYEYPLMEIDGSQYTLTNDWLFSNVMDNFNSNKPNDIASGSRSVVLHNGYLYFPNRDANQPTYVNFKKVNVADGDMFDAIPAADYLFKVGGEATNEYVFGPANDLKKDNAGHVITCNLITSAKGEWQVWVLDPDKGTGKLLIDETHLNDDYADNTTLRIDAMGVYGDVTRDAIIMVAASSTSDVYYWEIKDGAWDGNHEWIKCEGGFNWGTAPQIFPISEDMFYVDGFSTYPILYNFDGEVLDFFDTSDEICKGLLTNRNGQTRAMGHNGLAEFELAGQYFLVCAGGNTVNNPASTFVLYKCKDENRLFNEMTQMWEFPYAGMGSVSNDVRTATPYVQIEDENTAKLCVYTNNNGYGVYTFKVNASTGINEVVEGAKENGINKFMMDGQLYIIRDGVRYNAMGAVVE